VFVFDGGAPALKRATLQARRRRREGRREDAARTAGRILAVQMARLAEEEREKRKRLAEAGNEAARREVEEEQERLPAMEDIVYADELGMSRQERLRNRKFRKEDAYHLPDLDMSIEEMAKPNDPRIMSLEELEEYARQFQNGADINLYDFSKIDFDSDFFKSLPAADRYNILNAARIRSRLRMGLSKEQLNQMFPDRMAFSRFQIERVKERNRLTQRLMYEMGMAGTDLTIGPNRIASDRNREYILVKNEGAEGGWALGVVSREKDVGQRHKPIDVDALDVKYEKESEDEELEDEEFEDVPIEGLNRLPKPKMESLGVDREEGGLFVENDEDLFEDEGDEDLNRAVALSLEDQHRANEDEDEDEGLRRAIAMSLEKQHGVKAGPEPAGAEEIEAEEEEPESPPPEWKQRAVEPAKPITSTDGRVVAHIVNNRAIAAVPRRRQSESSDSEVDLQAALAAARKKQTKSEPKPQPMQASAKATKSPFDGPLPFEKLDWRGMLSAKASSARKEAETGHVTETGELEAESEDEAGGFIKEPEESASNDKMKPLPLPPWLTDTTDIRESLRKEQEREAEMNARAEEMEAEFRFGQGRDDEVIEIGSSSSDSDVEILDAPPKPAPVQKAPSPEPGASLPSLADLLKENAERAAREEALKTKSAAPEKVQAESVEAEAEAEVKADEDEDAVFEDVSLPTARKLTIEITESVPVPSEPRGETAATLAPHEEDVPLEESTSIDPDAPAAEEFSDFSDPEDEALLAQLAEEAEEHARFASQLNNKSVRENQQDYEQELRSLRSQQKRDRRDADEVTQVMISECQTLLQLFGIPYITAPMEAEAQCAELVRLGLVDGIVTDDSDTFLFGGTRVYKNVFNSNKYVECYLASEIESELSLSREQLISLALLLGSDYTEGLPGVGPVTALEILSHFPPGDKQALIQFAEWWTDVQQRGRPASADASSPWRTKFRRAHATKLFLPPGWPSPAVWDAYLSPEVDSSPEPFQWGVPDVEGLRRFLMGTVGWGKEKTDEVLLPVVRDMNRREVEGTQMNITRWVTGTVGAGVMGEAFAPRVRQGGSKRMARAVERLRRGVAGGNIGEGVEQEGQVDTSRTENICKRGRGRKRKAREVVEEKEEEKEGDEGNEEEYGEEEDGEYQAESEARKTRGRGKGKARGKKSKA